ncbi:MAG: hypothetical protein L6U16_03225 [Porphyromonadaceae bacterium]|nr:MAG: hypothetical protein L6U16_03225 [Porphyromonadaceae bacterium]
MLKDKPSETLVVVDEIPEVPELLNEVHRLISEKKKSYSFCAGQVLGNCEGKATIL